MKKKMTYERFLKILSRLRHKWRLTGWQDMALRGGKRDCPITAVYRSITGEFLPTDDYRYGAKEMGLHGRTAEMIVSAADSPNSASRCEREIRRDLLKACRLQERPKKKD